MVSLAKKLLFPLTRKIPRIVTCPHRIYYKGSVCSNYRCIYSALPAWRDGRKCVSDRKIGP